MSDKVKRSIGWAMSGLVIAFMLMDAGTQTLTRGSRRMFPALALSSPVRM